MTHVKSRKVKRYCLHVYICCFIVFSCCFTLFFSTRHQFQTCLTINYDNETIDRYDEWQYQNSITGQWYPWHITYDYQETDVKWNVKWFNTEPVSYLGVIVYLAIHSEMKELRLSLTQLSRLLVNNPRPVVIFHQGDFNDNITQNSLAQALGPNTPLGFEQINFPNKSNRLKSVHRTIHLGYFHMCRFFTLMLPHHPLLRLFQYYWRLDAHSYIFAPTPIQDPFEIMQNQQIQYAFIMVNEEADHYVTGLWSLFHKFLRDRCLQPSLAFDKTQTGWFGGYSSAMIFTNFAIANVSIFRDHYLIRAWLKTVDDNGGIYRYRWGDAPIHTIAVTQFIPRNDIVRLRYFGYFHRREYVCTYGIHGKPCREQAKPFFMETPKGNEEYDDGCFPSTWNPLCHYYREIRL
ncbi:hypothetical protein I4U23_023873 [Adineta vaga]|nr:hypothetical protein I4U23_023873 [Adineta vaga]